MAEDITKMPLPKREDYEPTDAERKLVAEVNEKFEKWREDRRPHEVQWFINAAMIRGLQWVIWNDALQKLEVKDVPSHRLRLTINRILSKYKARQAKFLKNRYTPIVVPASSDREDKMNAEATQKALEYILRKEGGEKKYRTALAWAQTAGKGFWWFYWDKSAVARVKDDPTAQVYDVPLGDVIIDPGSPFEVLVKDPGLTNIGAQEEIMRVKTVPVKTLQETYGQKANGLKGESATSELFQYQKQIAGLSAKGTSGLAPATYGPKSGEDELTHITRKELFIAPNAKFPRGRYLVVAGDRLLKQQDFLPYAFHEDRSNPFPVVEFADIEVAGQFWCPTIVEQMVSLQKEYNLLRSKVAEQIKLQAHPKVIVPVQCQWPKGAWNSEPGEVIRVVLPPGVPEPKIVHPPNIAQDVWNAMNIIRQEFDEVSNIYPAMQGAVGQASSGFQTNLLQEAADSVHAPDIRGHEMAFEEACRKIRKMMQQGYDVPRLIAIAGRSNIPDVMEFSQDQIDEHADIIVHTGTALSSSPAVRTQQVIELWNAQILGDIKNPETQRRALTMIDSSGIGELQEESRRDEEKARLENLRLSKGEFVNPPLPFDNHEIHWTFHTDQMKSPEFETWPPEKQQELFAHTLVHGKWVNPQHAITLAIELGMPPQFIQFLQPAMPPGQPGQDPNAPPQGQPGMPPPQPGMPPQGPPMPPQGPQMGPVPPEMGGPPMAPPMPLPGPEMPPPGLGLEGGAPPLPMGGEPMPAGPPMPPVISPDMASAGVPLMGLPGMAPPPVVVSNDKPKRKLTRVIRDPETQLIIGAETIEQPLEDEEEEGGLA